MGPSEEPRHEAWQTGPNPAPGVYGARASVPPGGERGQGDTTYGGHGQASTHGDREPQKAPQNTKQRVQAEEVLRAFRGEVAPGPGRWQESGIQFIYRVGRILVRDEYLD